MRNIYAKSIVAFVAALLTALLVEWTGGADDPFQLRDILVALAAALTSGALVFAVPNSPRR